MKKRLTSLLTAFVLVAAMCASVASAVEATPRYEPCSCGGYIGTVQTPTGEERHLGKAECPVNSRFNCNRYSVEYQVLNQCSSCGKIYKSSFITKIEFRHDHSAGRAI